MDSLKMFCLSLHEEDYTKIKNLGYVPVGLGKSDFNENWLRDNTKINISFKNSNYGEYSFHYWFWKNMIDSIDDNTWIGFCAYRRFWGTNFDTKELKTRKDFLNSPAAEWNKNSVILGQPIHMDRWTMMKIIKHGLRSFIKQPKFFLKKNRNLKLHFDSFHGIGNLDKAIDLLEEKEKKDFSRFMIENNSFNRGNMFICKSKKLITDYYASVFPWLERCEKIFGLGTSNNYGTDRMYGFLAERYLSYWFNKYSNVQIWPIIFYDINKNNL